MIQRVKRSIGILSAVFLGVILVKHGNLPLGIPVASAQASSFVFDNIMSEFNTKWSMFVELGIMISFILYPLVSLLMDPKFFLDITGGGQGQLLTIWQLSRDIMNTVFAFMLIAGAMMTVVMAKADYMKKYALKFIIGVILVNFSWFFPRVILDVSHVLTANIYQIPNIVGTQCQFREADGTLRDCEFPARFTYFPDASFINNSGVNTGQNGWKCVSDIICYLPEKLNNSTNTAGGVLAGLMLNHARLGEMNKVLITRNAAANASTTHKLEIVLTQLVHIGLQFVLVLYITFIIAGMAIALLVRIPVLWMTMAFMPIMFLGFVAGDLLPAEMNPMKIFTSFIKAAFLPAAMAVPLAVGFILVNTLAFSTPPESALLLVSSTGHIIPGVKSLWSFLWLLIAIVIMWKGFKMAVGSDGIFSSATSSVIGFGDSLGTLAKNAPLNIPLPLFGKGAQHFSVGQVGSTLSQLASASSTGRVAEQLQTLRGGNGSSNGPGEVHTITNINVDSQVSSAINQGLTTGLQPNDLQRIATEIKRQFPNAAKDHLVEKVRSEIEKSGHAINQNQNQLNQKLEELRNVL